MRHTSSRSHRAARATRAGVLVLALGLTSVAVGCGGDDDAEPVPAAATGDDSARPDYGLVTPQQAAALAAEGVTVIDVRTPEEFADGHIDGAELVDFYDATFADQIAALDPDQEYLVYCRSGNRSGQAVALMRELGFGQVWDLDGGVAAYGAAGLPLVR